MLENLKYFFMKNSENNAIYKCFYNTSEFTEEEEAIKWLKNNENSSMEYINNGLIENYYANIYIPDKGILPEDILSPGTEVRYREDGTYMEDGAIVSGYVEWNNRLECKVDEEGRYIGLYYDIVPFDAGYNEYGDPRVVITCHNSIVEPYEKR